MINEEEKQFMAWWKENRLKKRSLVWTLAAGLPLGTLIALGVFINFFSGWYIQANMALRMDHSGVLVIIIALLLIVIFMVVFSARHKWELNEQRYLELKHKYGDQPLDGDLKGE